MRHDARIAADRPQQVALAHAGMGVHKSVLAFKMLTIRVDRRERRGSTVTPY
jgi:hypothetical protein